MLVFYRNNYLLFPNEIILFGTYFIGWLYKIFPGDYLIFLENITNTEEPFSGIFI